MAFPALPVRLPWKTIPLDFILSSAFVHDLMALFEAAYTFTTANQIALLTALLIQFRAVDKFSYKSNK
jgi:hypothetical protein